ncbi:hypothetical protein FRC17_006365, partial [Serendipita sp. 399]
MSDAGSLFEADGEEETRNFDPSLQVAATQNEAGICGLHVHPELRISEDLAANLFAALEEANYFRGNTNQVMLFGRRQISDSGEIQSGLPAFLDDLIRELSALCRPYINLRVWQMLFPNENVEPRSRQVILNRYKPGEGISPHVDLLDRYDDGIIGISLGSGCAMDFARVESPEGELDTSTQKSIWLEENSVLVLEGDARYKWTHGIRPSFGDRVSREHDDAIEIATQGFRLYERLVSGDKTIPERQAMTACLNDILTNLESICTEAPQSQYPLIQELPPELLIRTFQLATDEDPAVPFILLMTCRSWKALVEDTSVLWSKIVIDESLDCAARTQAQLHYSKSAPLSIAIQNGRSRMISILDTLLDNHFHRIIHFSWNTPSRGFEKILVTKYFSRMRNLASLALDYSEPVLPSLLENYASLRRIEIQVISRRDLDNLFSAISKHKSLKSLTILIGLDYSDTGPLDARIMAS